MVAIYRRSNFDSAGRNEASLRRRWREHDAGFSSNGRFFAIAIDRRS